MKMLIARRTGLVALLLMLAANDAPAADDLFTGTFTIEQDKLVFSRCAIGDTHYALLGGTEALATVRGMLAEGAGPVQGDIIGHYVEHDGQPALAVSDIGNLAPGSDCHLSHAVATIGQEAAAKTLKPESGLVGHYYLSGVMETGSELLLRGDGSFEWYISYGAVDQFAKGRWGSDGKAVVLTAALPGNDRPLYRFREIEPWSEAAEDELRERDYDAFDDKVREHCPFLAAAVDVAASPAPIALPGSTPPSAQDLRDRAASMLTAALAARAQVEQLARAEVAQPKRPATNDRPDHLTASEAMGAWESARYEAIAAARAAGLDEPVLADPALPARCALAQRQNARDIPEAKWVRGIGVHIVDEASGQGARDVAVTLKLADGTEVRRETAGRGLAMVPAPLPAPVVAVALAAPYAPGRDQTIAVAPTRIGVIDISIDAQQLMAAPFETMRLRIESGDLIPDLFGRGRYQRQGQR